MWGLMGLKGLFWGLRVYWPVGFIGFRGLGFVGSWEGWTHGAYRVVRV